MKKALSKVFLWLFVGLLIAFGTAYVVSLNPDMVSNIFSGIVRYILIGAELLIAIALGAFIHKMSKEVATCVYLFYTFLTGLTLSAIFVTYNLGNLVFIFLVASCLFGTFAIIGKLIKADLSKYGIFIMMALIGVVALGIINFFLGSSLLNTILSIVGLIVFLAYTCYDINRLNRELNYGDDGKVAILGALSLFIDYINIVMDLLNLFGRRR